MISDADAAAAVALDLVQSLRISNRKIRIVFVRLVFLSLLFSRGDGMFNGWIQSCTASNESKVHPAAAAAGALTQRLRP